MLNERQSASKAAISIMATDMLLSLLGRVSKLQCNVDGVDVKGDTMITLSVYNMFLHFCMYARMIELPALDNARLLYAASSSSFRRQCHVLETVKTVAGVMICQSPLSFGRPPYSLRRYSNVTSTRAIASCAQELQSNAFSYAMRPGYATS